MGASRGSIKSENAAQRGEFPAREGAGHRADRIPEPAVVNSALNVHRVRFFDFATFAINAPLGCGVRLVSS
jgi:hypothetical protein